MLTNIFLVFIPLIFSVSVRRIKAVVSTGYARVSRLICSYEAAEVKSDHLQREALVLLSRNQNA